ncbi:MAG: PQQ-binding-like beta-propeller repeat protein [Thermoleophilia bacterium]|nr:PQQ-binding-like beta-propeller repeat protein [Thermoleophilia bacterium]MDH3725846.1 PQQ-binding-like beta-propeller repeat protein [Thermoleophilia bacterium]
MLRTPLALVAGIAVAMPAIAGAAPAIDRGWPVPAPPGTVVQGPGGGPVVSSSSPSLINDFAVVAHRKNGRRQWFNLRSAACGNCDGGAETRLWPDGTYGPIGFTGDDFWSVDQDGNTTEPCSGVVLADSTCISSGTTRLDGTFDRVPTLSAVRGGTTLWEHVESEHLWTPEFGVPPTVVRDGAGISYVYFERGVKVGGGTSPARLIAVNPSGTLSWRKIDGGEPLAALGGGVVVRTATGVAILNPDGNERWSRATTSPRSTRAVADVQGGRVYLHDLRRQPTVLRALSAATGQQLWRTTTAALASVSRRGRVYVIDQSGPRNGIRAITRDGRLLWRFPTARRVYGAAELRDGRVAISTGGRYVDNGALLFRVNPRRRAARVRRGSMSLTRRTFFTECRTSAPDQDRHCSLDLRAGTILRIRLRHAAKVRIRFRELNGTATPGAKDVAVNAPAGHSRVRVLATATRVKRGRHHAIITWRERGRTRVARIPFRTL